MHDIIIPHSLKMCMMFEETLNLEGKHISISVEHTTRRLAFFFFYKLVQVGTTNVVKTRMPVAISTRVSSITDK